MKNTDVCIIGAGSAGLSVAAVLAQMDLNVVLIESHEMGGECLNNGCVPSKALLASAKAANVIRHAEEYGFSRIQPEINFTKVMERVANIIAAIAPHDSKERFEKLGAKVVLGEARFIDQTTVEVNNQKISAKKFVIATGSKPAIPNIPGLKSVPFYTNETIFNLREAPKHLVIIGGGAIGSEMAQAFCYLGVKVTVLEAFRVLPRDDEELVAILKQKLIDDGITIHENVNIEKISGNDGNIEIFLQDKSLHCSHVLIAAGRRPHIEGLNLEAAGVQYHERGIGVDLSLRTSNKKIYAIGDVVGPYQFTHMASYQAGIIIRQLLFHLPAKVSYNAVPWVTYTQPELAHVGKHLDEAKKIYKNVKVFSWNYLQNDRAQTEGETIGKIKVITDKSGRVLGVDILGHGAGELINPWIQMIQKKQKLKTRIDYVVPYPTYSEINKSVASEFYKPLLFSKWMKKVVHFLMKMT